MSYFLLARIPGLLLIDLGLDRFMPMMICRMIMSLRKAADSTRPMMSIEVPTEPETGNWHYSHPLHPVDNIKLSVFKR